MIELDDLGRSGPAIPAAGGWRPLSRRARPLFVFSGAIGAGVPGLVALTVATVVFLHGRPPLLASAMAGWLLLAAAGAWLGLRRYRYTLWSLDDDGFGLRRGRMWYTETRVPASRVQHLDIRRGPLERRFGLSTLLVHTAGTRQHAVAIPGLDAADAERLRDRLARQVESDDDEA